MVVRLSFYQSGSPQSFITHAMMMRKLMPTMIRSPAAPFGCLTPSERPTCLHLCPSLMRGGSALAHFLNLCAIQNKLMQPARSQSNKSAVLKNQTKAAAAVR